MTTRLQDTAFTAIDGRDDAAAGRREVNARVLLVVKQWLSQLNAVAFAHQHAGFQVTGIGPSSATEVTSGARRNALVGCAGQRDIQAFLDFRMHKDCR